MADFCFDAVVREHRFPKGNLIFSQMICRTSVRGRNTVRHASRLHAVSVHPAEKSPKRLPCAETITSHHTKARRAMFCFLLKTGFMSIAPENIAALHSPMVLRRRRTGSRLSLVGLRTPHPRLLSFHEESNQSRV